MRPLLSLPCALICLAIASSAHAETAPAPKAQVEDRYRQVDLVANKEKYRADRTEAKMINAWGIANRPKGAGGHFWVTGKDTSFEYVGDVHYSPDTSLQDLHDDGKVIYVKIPVGGDDKFATGVVFSDSTSDFTITQEISGVDPVTAPAKFLFASDGGFISAWTERKKADGSFDRSGEALKMIDESANGAQFFGLTLSHEYSRLYAANFGTNPGVRVYDGAFKPENIRFDLPFDANHNGTTDAGEYAPFNVQALTTPAGDHHIFVTYAKTQPCPKKEAKKGACKLGELFAGEEDTSKPGQGRLAEFTEDGKLVTVWEDGGKLSAPWGLAFAPANFGALSGTLLVGNFGDGTIAAFDPTTHKFIANMKNIKGKTLKIEKIWGLLFGNGESLGDSNALYFAAGPDDEKDGKFGSLRVINQ